MATTVTWLMALHLIFTYGPKAIDMANGIQQFAQNQKVVAGASPPPRYKTIHKK